MRPFLKDKIWWGGALVGAALLFGLVTCGWYDERLTAIWMGLLCAGGLGSLVASWWQGRRHVARGETACVSGWVGRSGGWVGIVGIILVAFVSWNVLSLVWAYSLPHGWPVVQGLGAALGVFVVLRVRLARPGGAVAVVSLLVLLLVVNTLLSIEMASSRLLLRPLIEALARINAGYAEAWGAWTGARMMTLLNANVTAPLNLMGMWLCWCLWGQVRGERARRVQQNGGARRLQQAEGMQTQQGRFARGMRIASVLVLAASVVLAAGFVLCVSVGTTLIGAVVCGLWVWLQGRGRRVGAALWLLPLVVCALAVVLLAPPQARGRFADLTHNASASERVDAFGDALKIASASPVAGSGPGVFEVRLMQVQDHYYESKYVHNQYLQVLDETGIIGLGLWCALLGATFVRLWRWRRCGDSALIQALLACFVLAALHSATDFEFSFVWFMAILCGLWALVDGSGDSDGDKEPRMARQRVARPRFSSSFVHIATVAIAAILVFVLLASGGGLYATARYEQLAARTGDVDLAEVAAVVDTGIRFDPFHAADYKALWLDTVGNYRLPANEEVRSQRYVADLQAMTDRSVVACETLAAYVEAQGDTAAAARYRARISRLRPFDPAVRQQQ